jgi:hypothetical protein
VPQDLLTNPGVQSALLPLISAFILSLLLWKVDVRWRGLALIAGFLVCVHFTTGLGFQSLTSTSKIILCSLFLPVLGIFLDWQSRPLVLRLGVLIAVLVASALWVVWPVLMREEGAQAWLIGARVVLYAAFIGGALLWCGRGMLHRECGSILGLGLGTGVTALLAASALYAQLSFAVAAAMGGLMLVALANRAAARTLGSLGLFAAAIPLGLLGSAATVYAKQPPLSLLFLALIPVFAAIPLIKKDNLWLRSAVSSVLALLPAIPAAWLAWRAAGPPVY